MILTILSIIALIWVYCKRFDRFYAYDEKDVSVVVFAITFILIELFVYVVIL
jgi:hypothetical protein